MHIEAVKPLQELQQLAITSGQNLQVASAYRGFERQLQIWNEKASGHRPVLNRQEQQIDVQQLSDWDAVQAILIWSALPGASRHHWGCDFDVFNPDCLNPNYQLQLTETEYKEGVQCDFNRWLNAQLDAHRVDFFRPYRQFTGGISPEPWHISYRPLADQYQRALTLDVLIEAIESADICLKHSILANIQEIFTRFVQVD